MNVQEFLNERGVRFDVLEHEQTCTAAATAHASAWPEGAMAKTVLLRADRGFKDVVAVLPANRQVDLSKVSRLMNGAEIELAAESDIAGHCPDGEVGVLPPFGSQLHLETIVDEQLSENREIAFEGDSHRDTIRMRFEDFRQLESPLVGDIAAG